MIDFERGESGTTWVLYEGLFEISRQWQISVLI